MKLLNIGGGNKAIPIPPYYAGWDHIMLDCDKSGNPDILLNAKDMKLLLPAEYDAVYSSHLLEHFAPWELPGVLAGMRHVLKADGWIECRVPDLGGLIRLVTRDNLEMDAFLYDSPGGPIHVLDVIFGYAPYVQRSEFMRHKTGFSETSLGRLLRECGFKRTWSASKGLEIVVFGFTQEPTSEARNLLKLP